ncbi:MAG: glycosyltransferase family 2 protein [Candidatus Bathyarchaeota archaeon]|nr:glycosyltransferase family 2 protein [Candidatus Bathyarchaeota archaeon]
MIIAGIPAYNEERTIAKVILMAQKHADMVVVCDDGSSDFTREIAQRLGAVVISHERNLGYGSAILTLFRKAKKMKADILLTIDADGQHDANDIPSLVQPIIEDKADIVVGSRFIEQNGNIPTYRRWGIKLLTMLSNGSGKQRLSDGQSGFRAYNPKAIRKLNPSVNGMGASAEILMRAREKGLRIAEVPVQVHYHGLETSTQNPISHGLGVLATILRLVVEERPLFYLGIPGAALLIIGMGFGLWTLQLFAVEKRIVTNVALTSFAFTLIGLFAVFTAITLYAIVRLTDRQHSERSY